MASVLTIFCPICGESGERTASPSRAVGDDAVIFVCGTCRLPFTLLTTSETVARIAALNGVSLPAEVVAGNAD